MRSTIFLLFTGFVVFALSCKKDETSNSPTDQNSGSTPQSCNPPVDSTYYPIQIFNTPDSINPNSNYRIRFSNSNSDSYLDFAFTEEPISGVYDLTDTLLGESCAEVHKVQNGFFQFTTGEVGEKLYVENNPIQMRVSFCHMTLFDLAGQGAIIPVEATYVYYK